MIVDRSQLTYPDYTWRYKSTSDYRILQRTDNDSFNRKEGYEMLYLIQRITEEMELESDLSVEKLERMIREKVPVGMLSRHAVICWVKAHFYSLNLNSQVLIHSL